MVDRDKAYKVTVGKINKYYCNKNEYDEIQRAKQLKDDTYNKIFECFNRQVTNSALFKEINELIPVYGYQKILGYVNENLEFLSGILSSKTFSSEYAQIRYFAAILKNNLTDYTPIDDEYKKNIEIDMPETNYKSPKKRRTLEEIEQEVGGEL